MSRTDARKGFTLIEVLVALVIAMIVFIGLSETGLVVLEANVRDSIRDGAVQLAGERMEDARSLPAASLPSGDITDNVSRTIRNLSVTYSVTRNVANITTDNTSKRVVVNVAWTRNAKNSSHTITTIVRSH